MKIVIELKDFEFIKSEVQDPGTFLDGLLGRGCRPGGDYGDYGRGAETARATLAQAAKGITVQEPEEIGAEAVAEAICAARATRSVPRASLLEGLPRAVVERLPELEDAEIQTRSDARLLKEDAANWGKYLVNASLLVDPEVKTKGARILARALDAEAARRYLAEARRGP